MHLQNRLWVHEFPERTELRTHKATISAFSKAEKEVAAWVEVNPTVIQGDEKLAVVIIAL